MDERLKVTLAIIEIIKRDIDTRYPIHVSYHTVSDSSVNCLFAYEDLVKLFEYLSNSKVKE